MYARRPQRQVYYLGIDKYIPIIESEKQRTRVEYTTTNLSDNLANTLLNKASYIFNREYTAYNKHKSRRGKTYIGVHSGGIKYSALSMSAGEQKVFLLLETIFRADKYSLILIDEIDLLLHNIALKKLLEVVAKQASDKNLQIVFTTHRESVIELYELLNIRHIVKKAEKTLCFNETKPDAIHRLTGKQEKRIEVFVEDDLAVAILSKISSSLKIKKYVSIKKFGAASNCFTAIAGILISQQDITNSLFVLDGDVLTTPEEQKKNIDKAITGHGDNIEELKSKALQHIKKFNLPKNTNPEKYLHSLLIEINNLDNEEFREIYEVAKEISYEQDNHKYLYAIIERLNYNRSVGYAKIIDLVSIHAKWQEYISEVFDWLNERVSQVRESD